jgi:hypothetical protein
LKRIIFEIGRLPGVTELAGLPTSSIVGRIAQVIERPTDLPSREDCAEKQREDENGAQ